jgi:hypothetical protein
MSVNPKPIAIGAKSCGAGLSEAPRIIIRNIKVSTISAVKQATSEYPPGKCAAYPLEAKPTAKSNPAFPLAMTNRTPAARQCAYYLRGDVGKQLRRGEALANS